jgi:N6-adenosine-specific RNA methylase IME4
VLEGAEFKELVASIKTHGYDPRHPILLFENAILDGRNRYLAARKAGVKPVFIQWQANGLDPFAFAWQENAVRRHLPPDVRACCYAKRLEREATWLAARQKAKQAVNSLRSEAAKKQHQVSNPRAGERSGHLSTDKPPETNHRHVEAAKVIGVSPATMGRAFALQSNRPDLFEQVCGREITMIEALRLKRKAEVRAAVQALPTDKFRVLYADPCWDYTNRPGHGAASDHYPTMPLSQICSLDIKSICLPDSVLFLWSPAPLLLDALEVLKAWGFTYKQLIVWDKVKHNWGSYFSARHELLLVAARGSCTPDCDATTVASIDSVQVIDRSEHSRKPEQFRKIIDTLYPHGARLELFARGKVPAHWRKWGAEVDGSD